MKMLLAALSVLVVLLGCATSNDSLPAEREAQAERFFRGVYGKRSEDLQRVSVANGRRRGSPFTRVLPTETTLYWVELPRSFCGLGLPGGEGL